MNRFWVALGTVSDVSIPAATSAATRATAAGASWVCSQSDHCFDRFISPISNPFFFEDPRSLTEARGIFIDNSLPSFIGSGDAQVWAGQLRGRVTDRVSIIAPRLGYLQVNQAGGGAPDGFMSAPVGLKYNFYPRRRTAIAVLGRHHVLHQGLRRSRCRTLATAISTSS